MTVAAATEVLMPRLSDSMEEGTILAWVKRVGDAVAVGEELAEIETDKANMAYEADVAGTLLEILVPEGETAAVGTPIARIGDPDADAPATFVNQRLTNVEGVAEGEAASASDPQFVPDSETNRGSAERRVGEARGGAVRVTPLARRIAAIHGVDLGGLAGTGAGGRITKGDVRAAAGLEPEPAPAPRPAAVASAPPSSPATAFTSATAPTPAPAPSQTPAPTPAAAPVEGAKGEAEIVEPSRLQEVIARRMAEAKSTVPHFQVETEVRMDAAIALRAELKAIAGEEPAPSFNDLVVRAAALALRRHPKANGSYRDGRFELHPRINVGIAVAADDALVVPTIADADRKSLGEIGRESRRLADRVRTGAVTPPELAGGTFTVSNLGMFGMTAINPVVNLPQAAILGVGATRHLLVRGDDGGVEDAALMTLTLSCDHRILYGAEAARFLGEIRDLLEEPLRIAF